MNVWKSLLLQSHNPFGAEGPPATCPQPLGWGWSKDASPTGPECPVQTGQELIASPFSWTDNVKTDQYKQRKVGVNGRTWECRGVHVYQGRRKHLGRGQVLGRVWQGDGLSAYFALFWLAFIICNWLSEMRSYLSKTISCHPPWIMPRSCLWNIWQGSIKGLCIFKEMSRRISKHTRTVAVKDTKRHFLSFSWGKGEYCLTVNLKGF